MELFLGYLLIFLARVVDVTMQTLRVLLLVRGRRLVAACIGFFEVSIYVITIKYVLDRLTDPLSLVIYSLGFATGNFVGGLVEERLALGYMTIQVIPRCDGLEMVEALRAEGFGVTVWYGQGREGEHMIIQAIINRRDKERFMQQVNSRDCQAFITVLDTRTTRGGIFNVRKGK